VRLFAPRVSRRARTAAMEGMGAGAVVRTVAGRMAEVRMAEGCMAEDIPAGAFTSAARMAMAEEALAAVVEAVSRATSEASDGGQTADRDPSLPDTDLAIPVSVETSLAERIVLRMVARPLPVHPGGAVSCRGIFPPIHQDRDRYRDRTVLPAHRGIPISQLAKAGAQAGETHRGGCSRRMPFGRTVGLLLPTGRRLREPSSPHVI